MDATSLHLALFSAILGSLDFNQRELASSYLKESPAHIASMLAHSYDPEVASRAVRVAREQRRDWAYATAANLHCKQFGRLPWIDGLHRAGADYGNTVRSYLEEARTNHEPAGGWTLWLDYRIATRLWLKDCLMDGVSVSELQRLLDICGEAETQWLAANKHNKSSWPPEVPCED